MSMAAFLLETLRSEPPRWPDAAGHDSAREFLETARTHGVIPLLHHRLRSATVWELWPLSVREALCKEARAQAALEIYQQQEVTGTLERLAKGNVPSLLMKGTALAYTLYPAPNLRPRGDTDLFIRHEDLEKVRTILHQHRYREVQSVSGELVSYQSTFLKRDECNLAHALDVHWRIVNPQRFADALSFAEVSQSSQSVPALGASAHALGHRDALMLACLHRAAHHHENDRLIWLYDIHLLSGLMTESDWSVFFRLADERRLQSVCARGLAAARTQLGTIITPAVAANLDRIHRTAPAWRPKRAWQIVASDLKALPNWQSRSRLLREHLFPAPSYILAKYGRTDRRLLPLLYLHRALRGSWKLGRRLRPVNKRREAAASRT